MRLQLIFPNAAMLIPNYSLQQFNIMVGKRSVLLMCDTCTNHKIGQNPSISIKLLKKLGSVFRILSNIYDGVFFAKIVNG